VPHAANTGLGGQLGLAAISRGGAPNVLLVLIDDAGFGNPSTFGGPISTPRYTQMAEAGLRYNRFHVTALCSPTRAALLTGRNNHAVGFGSIGELSSGFPGYTATVPRDCTPLPRILAENGYSTAAFGKWHLAPDGQQGAAGGQVPGQVRSGVGPSARGGLRPAKELGVIPADAEPTPRDEAFPAWDEVPDKLKAYYARQMEVYAGYSENADFNVGRVDAIDELGELDNTVIIWIWGDNGASLEGAVTGSFNELMMQNGIPLSDEMQLQLAERYGGIEAWGGQMMDPHYSAAWAWAGNTPFR
jgi:arylsulfatase A-like enzyme